MYTIRLPRLQGVQSGTASEWMVKTGDSVAQGDLLARFDTETGPLELSSDVEGTIREILVPAGTTAAVEKPLVLIGGPDEDASAAAQAARDELQQAPTAPVETTEKPMTASEPKGDVTPVLMPKAGNTMEEGTIIEWKVAEGDSIKKGQILFEVETDKAVVEVEAIDSGTLAKIVASEDETVPVLTPVAYLAESAEDVEAYLASEGGGTATQSEPAPAAEKPSATQEEPAELPDDVTPIVMPKAGNTMEEGTIIEWKVSEGDIIEKGQIIFEVETDKAVVEVEAIDSGRLSKIVAGADETVPVLEPVAYLADSDEALEAYLAGRGKAAPSKAPEPKAPDSAPAPLQPQASAQAAPAAPAAKPTAAATTDTGRVKASPAARKFASEKNVDLNAVGSGSGPKGRILSTDVAQAAAGGAATAPQAPQAAPAAASTAPAAPVQVSDGQATRRKMSGMRKAIARNLLASKQNIPHFYMKIDVNAEPLVTFYKAQKASYQLSLNDVLVKACGQAIHEFPAFRTQLDGDETVEFANSNIGIAVGMDRGLVVPVVKGVEQLQLPQLAAETQRIVDAARTGKIENMGEGVFTISNLGMFGIPEFSAIINPPEAAILAVGAAREEMVVSEGTMRIGKVMTLTLSCDHRIIDGLLAAKFLARLKELLEWPGQLA
ncbi:MAG: 2-oxo acid dehydrogenase subunit E2 [Phycisphaerae bacterium]